MGWLGPLINGASRSAQTARGSGSSRGAGSGSGSSQGGSSGAGSQSSGSRGSAGGSSASSAKGAQMERRRRTCRTCPDWRYEMGMRVLGGVPWVYQYHHLFLVAWNRGGTGMMPTYSAFPSRPDGNPGILGPISGALQSDSSKSADEGHAEDPSNPADMGFIKSDIAADYYVSGEVAPGNRFVTLKDTATNYNPQLVAQSLAMDALRVRYVPAGPNSNTFAMSLAKRVGLPERKPAGDAPGSGMRI
jgi:hypothetical protein